MKDADSLHRLFGCALLWLLPTEQAHDAFEYIRDAYDGVWLRQEAAKQIPPARRLVTATAVASRQRPALVIDEEATR